MCGVSGKVDDDADPVECGIDRDSSSSGTTSAGSETLRTCEDVRTVVGVSELTGSEAFLVCPDITEGFLLSAGAKGDRAGGTGNGKVEGMSRSSISIMLCRFESIKMSSSPSPASGRTRRKSKSVVVSRVSAGVDKLPRAGVKSERLSDDVRWGTAVEKKD